MGHDVSWAVWITGRPGSGKTTIARQLAQALERQGQRVAVLEASGFGADLIPGRSPSPHELDIVHRAVIRTAAELIRVGIPVIIDATAPRRAWREMARASIGRFAEVQLLCPDEVCGAREQAARWNRMRDPAQGSLASVEPDIVLDYEYSLRADLTVNTDVQHVWTAVEDILGLIGRLGRASPAGPSSDTARGQPGA